jgi:hypothetical protein
MDILTSSPSGFIRYLYTTASDAFLIIIKRKIEVGEEPYIPPYSEDAEPPFLDEWLEAIRHSTCLVTRPCRCLQAHSICGAALTGTG